MSQVVVLPPGRSAGSPAPMGKSKKKNKNRRKKTVQKKKKVKAQSAATARVRARAARFHLSECSRMYLQAVTDPFKIQAGVACIPDDQDVPSLKVLAITRGTFNVGTNQVGWVFVDPSCGVNDEGAIVSTTASFTGTTLTWSSMTPSQTTFSHMSQMPYTSDQLSAALGITHRTVGCGLRVRYTGSELNRSGRIIPYRSNAVRVSDPIGNTTSNFLSRAEVPSDPCDREWHCVTYLPTKSVTNSGITVDSYNYSAYALDHAVADISAIGFDLGFFVDGAVAGNGFEYEVYVHKEYISSNTEAPIFGMTRSHSDTPGLSAVRNALEGVIPSTDGGSYYEGALEYLRSFSPDDISGVISGTRTVAKALGYTL